MSKFDTTKIHKALVAEFVKAGGKLDVANMVAAGLCEDIKGISDMWFGDKSVTPVEFDGLAKMIEAHDGVIPIIDVNYSTEIKLIDLNVEGNKLKNLQAFLKSKGRSHEY